jgi:hypothetical protein
MTPVPKGTLATTGSLAEVAPATIGTQAIPGTPETGRTPAIA